MDFSELTPKANRRLQEELLNSLSNTDVYPELHTPAIDFSTSPDLSQQFHHLRHQISDFLALQETCLEQLHLKEAARERQFQFYCQELTNQTQAIQHALADFKTVMTQAGAARWRMTAEETLAQGQAHLAVLQTQAQHFQHMLETGTERINTVTKLAEVRISRVVRSFRLEYFKYLLDQSSQQVQQASQSAIHKISTTIRWFHWEKFGIAILVAVIVAIVLGLFVNDEWPWESHYQVANERQAGRFLMQAWPELNEVQKAQLKTAITNHHPS